MDREEINKKWESMWESKESPGWHLSKVNFYLKSYFERFVSGDPSGKRILVPLCGATVDMAWLHEQGLSVVGIELSEIAIKKFFKDAGLTYTVSSVIPEGKVFRHDDRLQIFQIDLFKVNPEILGGKFDFWLDRGSLVAMVAEEKRKYSDLIISLMNTCARGFVEVFEYDPAARSGPPRPIFLDELSSLFAEHYEIELLGRLHEDEMQDIETKIGHNAYRVFHLLKAK